MAGVLKWTGRALVVALALMVAAFFWVRWRIDHETAAPRPLESAGPTAPGPWFKPGWSPAPLAGPLDPDAPFMAPGDRASMHGGAYQSDVHRAAALQPGPLEIRTRRSGGSMTRQCATFTFLSGGELVALCGGLTSFRLNLIDPETLDQLAFHDLPMRPSAFQALIKRDMTITMNDTSGGAYFYLDDRDRVVVADSRQVIQRIAPRQDEQGRWAFVVEDRWDMSEHVPHDCQHYDNWFASGECDAITTVMPDWNGMLWWVTRYGRVGVLDPDTGRSEMIRLEGEEIQNAFAVDARGPYIVTDHAMYAFHAPAGAPVQRWRHAYDRGSSVKQGSVNQGSGTTPTLLGEDYIGFTDNADGRIRLAVLRRGDLAEGETRQVCAVPLFTENASGTENSMIGFRDSFVVENNHGYVNAEMQEDWSAIEGGVERVRVLPDGAGCERVWRSPLKVPSVVPKLSVGDGLAYFYTFEQTPAGQLWSLVGLDFETGEEIVRVPTGHGVAFNNNYAAIAIAPQGDLYVGTRHGFMQIRSAGP